jgi:hypothetical protein
MNRKSQLHLWALSLLLLSLASCSQGNAVQAKDVKDEQSKQSGGLQIQNAPAAVEKTVRE